MGTKQLVGAGSEFIAGLEDVQNAKGGPLQTHPTPPRWVLFYRVLILLGILYYFTQYRAIRKKLHRLSTVSVWPKDGRFDMCDSRFGMGDGLGPVVSPVFLWLKIITYLFVIAYCFLCFILKSLVQNYCYV